MWELVIATGSEQKAAATELREGMRVDILCPVHSNRNPLVVKLSLDVGFGFLEGGSDQAAIVLKSPPF